MLLKEHNDLQYLLCKSSGRKKKEAAIRNKQELNNLSKQVKKTRNRDVSEIERKLGRLKERYSRVTKYYWFKYEPCKFEVKFPAEQLNPRLQKSLDLLFKKFAEGVISYNQLQTNLKTDEIWNIYVMLTRVEKAFHDLKNKFGTSTKLSPVRG